MRPEPHSRIWNHSRLTDSRRLSFRDPRSIALTKTDTAEGATAGKQLWAHSLSSRQGWSDNSKEKKKCCSSLVFFSGQKGQSACSVLLLNPPPRHAPPTKRRIAIAAPPRPLAGGGTSGPRPAWLGAAAMPLRGVGGRPCAGRDGPRACLGPAVFSKQTSQFPFIFLCGCAGSASGRPLANATLSCAPPTVQRCNRALALVA